MVKNKFIGTWKLLKVERKFKKQIILPFGENPEGILIYTESYMSAQLGNSDRKNFTSEDYRMGSDKEINNAFNSYIAYYGTYEIDEVSQIIYHRVQQSLFPNWVGTKQKRFYEFKGNLLLLSALDPDYTRTGSQTTLTWERV